MEQRYEAKVKEVRQLREELEDAKDEVVMGKVRKTTSKDYEEEMVKMASDNRELRKEAAELRQRLEEASYLSRKRGSQ